MPAGVSANRWPSTAAVDGPFSRIERATKSRVRVSSPLGRIPLIFTTLLCRNSTPLAT